MQNNNKKAFSLIIAIFLMLLTSLLAIFLLEYIIPFSRNVKGMENGTKAYYEANKGIEEVLYFIKNRSNLANETGSLMGTTSIGFSYQTSSSGQLIPKPGEGNSEYDSNYNIISQTKPLQLEVGYNSLSLPNRFSFKVPDLDGDNTSTGVLSGGTMPIINWLLSSSNDTLIASGSYLTVANNGIRNSLCTNILTCSTTMVMQNGLTLSGSSMIFQVFYVNNCGINSGCILKMSIVNNLELTTGEKIPYLEYKIQSPTKIMFDRYSNITTSGKSYGYQKNLKVKVPQQTTIEAFDFTVFQ